MNRWWRVFPLEPNAVAGTAGGPLFCPRAQQGAGRHDRPDQFGVLYLSAVADSAVAEQLAPFRGAGSLTDGMLHRGGRRLALAGLQLDSGAALVDLDAPLTLSEHRLRPSMVATRQRAVTQDTAAQLFHAEPDAVGLRWWSTLESSWINATLFAERALPAVTIGEVAPLTVDHPAVRSAALALGLH